MRRISQKNKSKSFVTPFKSSGVLPSLPTRTRNSAPILSHVISTPKTSRIDITESQDILESSKALVEDEDFEHPVGLGGEVYGMLSPPSSWESESGRVPTEVLKQDKKELDAERPAAAVTPDQFTGCFFTANGKTIKVSDESLRMAKRLWDGVASEHHDDDSTEKATDVSINEDSRPLHSSTPQSTRTAYPGPSKSKPFVLPFKKSTPAPSCLLPTRSETAITPTSSRVYNSSMSNISVSESLEILESSKAIFEDEDDEFDLIPFTDDPVAASKGVESCEKREAVQESIVTESVIVPELTFTGGFSTASGKNIHVSEEALKAAKKLLDSVCDSSELAAPEKAEVSFNSVGSSAPLHTSTPQSSRTFQPGLSTSKPFAVPFRKPSAAATTSSINAVNSDEQNTSTFSNATTASTSHVSITESQDILESSKALLEDDDFSMSLNISDDEEPLTPPLNRRLRPRYLDQPPRKMMRMLDEDGMG